MLKITHNAGFFSCCSIRLHQIIQYYNIYKMVPIKVDSSEQFKWYKCNENKCNESSNDITHQYFNKDNEEKYIILAQNKIIDFKHYYQFFNYQTIDYLSLRPFIVKYFSPSKDILSIISSLENKYKLLDNFENICVLFHRGNDKITETKIPSYEETFSKAESIIEKNPNIRFLIQSDETEFIKEALDKYPNSIVFNDEIRHIPKNNESTVDKCMNENNLLFSKYYLAITIIMSKCKYIICGSGNCSIWIMLYRRNANNIIQYLKGEWISSIQ